MLELQNVSSGYGAIEALKSINHSDREGRDRHVDRRERRGEITTLRNITGLVPLTSGEIFFEGRR